MSRIGRLAIRPAREEDVDVLVSFNMAMALETEGRSLDQERLRHGVLAVFQSPTRGFYMVAERSEQPPSIIGQLLVTYEWSDWRNASFWWIQSVYVRPGWRRQGVYRRMHQSILDLARVREDVCGIRLYAEEHNVTAQVVYEHVGLCRSSYRIYEQDFVLPKIDRHHGFCP
ncbi:MAG: GNAT family N-acetyltransferase [Nitrospiraceae bacterium]